MESLKSLFTLPLALPNPVKILGAVSGVALTVGGLLLIFRRWLNKDEVGANGYADYLFLYMMTLVGLTGMLSWITRLIGIPMLAYVNYFIHMVVVFNPTMVYAIFQIRPYDLPNPGPDLLPEYRPNSPSISRMNKLLTLRRFDRSGVFFLDKIFSN